MTLGYDFSISKPAVADETITTINNIISNVFEPVTVGHIVNHYYYLYMALFRVKSPLTKVFQNTKVIFK